MATVTLQNYSSFDKNVEVFDAVCSKNFGVSHFSPWETKQYTMCLNDVGHGTIWYKSDGDPGFTESAFLSDGDNVNIM